MDHIDTQQAIADRKRIERIKAETRRETLAKVLQWMEGCKLEFPNEQHVMDMIIDATRELFPDDCPE